MQTNPGVVTKVSRRIMCEMRCREDVFVGLWCYCKRKDDGSLMINCDNKHCEIKWFHMRCTLPKKWFCDRCTARSASIDLIPE